MPTLADTFPLSPLHYEAGRATYLYHPYAIYDSLPKNKTWKFSFGWVCHIHNHVVKAYLMSSDPQDFACYLDEERTKKTFLTHVKNVIDNEVAGFEKRNRGVVPTQLSQKALNVRIKDYHATFARTLATAWALRAFDRALVSALNAETTPVLFASLSEILSISQKKSLTQKKEEAFIFAAQKLKEKKKKITASDITRAAEKLHAAYAHTSLGYYHEPFESRASYETKLQGILAHNPKQLLAALAEKHASEQKHYSETLKRLHVAPALRRLIKLGGESAWLKDYYKFSMNRIMAQGHWLLAEAAKRTGKSIDVICDLTPSELDGLLKGKEIDPALVEERMKESILICYKKKQALLLGSDATQFIATYLTHSSQKPQGLSGRIACAGEAEGPARVVLGSKDFTKVQQGDIIVVMNTSPDFTAVLHRVSGIIAEEGGITAHVSVISRELRIPCIVGVRNATHLVTDGERLRLNATKGIATKV